MQFSYQAYGDLIALLSEYGYAIADYHSCEQFNRCAILRHDVDTCMDKALDMAHFEAEKGIRSTFFILLRSELYNAAAKDTQKKIRGICALGHEIGLHFDETAYEKAEKADVPGLIQREAGILSDICEYDIKTVSMHRPSQKTLKSNYSIPGIINSYSQLFFSDYKYLSDSRHFWREPVESIIISEKYEKLHILTHPFWYAEHDTSIETAVKQFVNGANISRYRVMQDNISRFDEIMQPNEVLTDLIKGK